jgi:hypothetical protein
MGRDCGQTHKLPNLEMGMKVQNMVLFNGKTRLEIEARQNFTMNMDVN